MIERLEPGTRVQHAESGREGRVAEQLGHNPETGVYGYMVVWDDEPGQKRFTTSARLRYNSDITPNPRQ